MQVEMGIRMFQTKRDCLALILAKKQYALRSTSFLIFFISQTLRNILSTPTPKIQPRFSNLFCLLTQIKIIVALLQIIWKMISPGKQVYPQDWSCIIDPCQGQGGLYIGNLQAAQNLNTLKKLQIRALLTAAKGVEINHPRTQVPYFLYVPAEDHEAFDISKYFQQAAGFIHECLQRTNIMIHCLAGVSRSVSLAIAFLIKHRGMTYSQAHGLIKGRRKIIHPNDGFIDLLKKFERSVPTTVREESKSLSPQKTYQRRDYTNTCSPNKQNRMDIDSILSRYESFKAPLSPNKLRNPESQYEIKRESFSPQKSQTRLKRFSSMNVDANLLTQRQSPQRRNIRQQIDYRPLGNVQNRGETRDYSDIDKRIQQIRKKYQEYVPTSNLKYNNYTGEENIYRGRTSSGYGTYNNREYVPSGRDYIPTSTVRGDYTQTGRDYMQKSREFQQYNPRRELLTTDFQGSKMKRLTSFQQY